MGWARRGARGAEAEASRRRAQEERRAERSVAAAMAERYGGVI